MRAIFPADPDDSLEQIPILVDQVRRHRTALLGQFIQQLGQHGLKAATRNFHGRDMSFDLGGKPFPAQPSAPSFQHAKRAIGAAAQAGYFCYDEMFVWANALLEDHPELPSWLARRFPLVILDEMQDTFELQASILDAVFPRNSAKRVVQRVGDPNQRIFDADDSSSESVDPFPDTACCVGIPNSYRFGPDIGTLASPFAVDPVGPSGLCGIGPRGQGASAQQCRHAIFVFPDNSTDGILESYGRYVLEELGQKLAAKGPVAAVGHIHQDHPDVQPGHSYYPKTVSHYWDRYTVEISRRDPHPKTFVQYVRAAQGMVSDDRMLLRGVDKVASAIIELARRIGDTGDLKHKGRTHRTLAAALVDDSAALAIYREVLKDFLLGKVVLSESDWESHKDRFAAIAAAICNGGTDPSNAEPFLAWPTVETGAQLPGNQELRSDLVYELN